MFSSLLPILVIVLLGGCGGTLEIRNDPSPAPLDNNYHTVLMSASCGEKYSMGQAGCSLSEDDNLDEQTLSVLSPLGGSVAIYSKGCGVDLRTYIPKGQVVTYKLSELIPHGVNYCSFSLYQYWEKPKEIQTEVPVRGQSGKFYVAIRKRGVGAAELSWMPQQGFAKSIKGIAYAQIREEAQEAAREPMLLQVTPTQSVSSGKYQLWSEPKQLGIKNTPYSGTGFEISREAILGTPSIGSYILAGWAIGMGEPLDNDFLVAVDIFGRKIAKLSGYVSFKEKEVCYETEATVSLVLLSGVEKASNKIKGCFPKPAQDAVMAFYTNVGRAAYAFIKGDTYQWIQ